MRKKKKLLNDFEELRKLLKDKNARNNAWLTKLESVSAVGFGSDSPEANFVRQIKFQKTFIGPNVALTRSQWELQNIHEIDMFLQNCIESIKERGVHKRKQPILLGLSGDWLIGIFFASFITAFFLGNSIGIRGGNITDIDSMVEYFMESSDTTKVKSDSILTTSPPKAK